MSTRLPREEPAMSIVGMWSGRLLAVIGIAICLLGAISDVQWIPLGVGLLLWGGGLAVVGGHRTRRPPRHVAVHGQSVRLHPEGDEYGLDELRPLTVRSWTFQRTDANDALMTSTRAAVHAQGADVELYLGSSEEECRVWLRRLEATLAQGADPDGVAPGRMDEVLEARPGWLTAVLAMLTGLLMGALLLVWMVNSPSAAQVLGAACAAMGLVWGWVAIGRRRISQLLCVLAGLILVLRPVLKPSERVFDSGVVQLGLFATPHLTLLAAGAGLVLLGLVAARAPGGRTAS